MPQPVDLERPLPDEAHEGLRLAVLQALADLTDSFMLLDTLFTLHDGATTTIGTNSADLSDILLLVDALFGLLDQTLTGLADAAAERVQLRADHDALDAKVAALETAVASLTPDVPGGLL